jgi:hypothetical protein
MSSLISAGPVREHVLLLRSAGASWQTIANAAGIGAMTVFDVMHCNARVSEATAAALLSVTPNDLVTPRVSANGAMLRLRSLQAMGHSSARIARAVGCHEQTIQCVVRDGARTVNAKLHQAVVGVYDAWWDKRPPERTPAERAAANAARRRAVRNNWCQGGALDEALLDTPGYKPRAAYRSAPGTGIARDLRGET